ncbi:MAG TPA: DUF4236 domain-containing protein [Longimicrobiales bacterium]
MGFYLRKSFRLGPVRLNLSKSGLGASIGVTGARIGITPRGRAYVHAGRGGLYFRQSLGGGRAGARSAGPVAPLAAAGAPITLYEETGVTYEPPDGPGDVAITRLRVESRPRPRLWPYWLVIAGLTLLGAAFADADGAARAALLIIGAGLLLAAALALHRARRAARAAERVRAALLPAVAGARPFAPDELAAARAALADPALGERALRAALEEACLDAARRIVEDGGVTRDELRLLEQLETELGLDPGFARAARADALRGVWLQVVADHEVTDAEEATLAELRRALRVAEDDVASELAIVRRLAGLRRIREGELPVVEPGVPLPEGEACHYADEARLLKERNLRRFQRARQVYRVRGLVMEREGRLLITSRRLLFIDAGSTSVPLDRILDVDVDLDRNLLVITRDGAKTPMLLTTPDAARAGAVLARAAGL